MATMSIRNPAIRPTAATGAIANVIIDARDSCIGLTENAHARAAAWRCFSNGSSAAAVVPSRIRRIRVPGGRFSRTEGSVSVSGLR